MNGLAAGADVRGLAARVVALAKGSDRTALLRYVLVGGFNTVLDIGLFTLFAVAGGLAPLLANVFSTTITLCVSYLLNRVFVFRTDRTVQHTVVQFVAVTLFDGLVVQSAVIWLVTRVGHAAAPHLSGDLLAPLAKVCAVGVGMVCNYLGYRWLFASRSRRAAPPGAPEESAPEDEQPRADQPRADQPRVDRP